MFILFDCVLLENTANSEGYIKKVIFFQEMNTKPQISEDSELGGCELGGYISWS